jgi:hypothetical protein
MIAEVPLFDDCPASVAVCAADLTLRDLPFEVGNGAFLAGELHHAPAFDTDVVEVQNDGVALTTVHTTRRSEVLEEEQKIAPARRPGGQRASPLGSHAPRPNAYGRAATVAVCAYQLAMRDLGLDAFQPVSLADELADLRPLRPNVVELQDGGIIQAAIRTRAGAQELEDVGPCRRPTLVASTSRLLSVEVASLADVLPAALLALRLSAVKIGSEENPATTGAHPGRLPADDGRRAFGHGSRPLYVPRPYADRRQGGSERSADLAKRQSLGTQGPRLCPFLPFCPHTNTCSYRGRTDLGA